MTQTHRSADGGARRPGRAARSCPPTARRGPVRPGPGHRAVGRRRQALPRLPSRPGRHEPRVTPTRRWPRRSPSRPPRCCTSPTSSAPSPPPRWPSTLDRLLGGGGQVFFCNSGAEANEAAIKLARRWGGRGTFGIVSAPSAASTAAPWPRWHATGQPEKHEAFQPLPEGFRHVAWNDLDALANAIDPSVAAVLLEPVQGEGGVNPATSEYFDRRPRAVRRAGPAAHGRRGADRAGSHRPLVRLPALRRRARRGHHGQGARQRRADRGLLGAGRGGARSAAAATTPRPSAASPAPRPPPERCWR